MFFDQSQLKRLSYFVDKTDKVGKRLYLWEINTMQREALIFLLKNGYNVEAFISFNVNPDLKKAWGINVYHPEYLNRPFKEDFILCISQYEYKLHERYLLDHLRLSRQQIFIDYKIPSTTRDIFIRGKDSILAKFRSILSLVKGTADHKLQQLKIVMNCFSGFKVYRKIRKKFDPKIPLLFFNYPGSGDAYLSSCIMEAYLQQKRIDNYIAIATGRVSKIVLESYGHQNIYTLTDVESDHLKQFAYFAGAEKLNIKMLIQLANHLDVSLRLAATRLNLCDMYAYRIFEYDHRPKIVFRRISTDQQQICELFKRNHLRKGFTVLISPYANSEVGFSPEFWSKIVSLLKRLGLDVATMCHEPEQPLKFTLPLDFPLQYATDVLEYAGYFLGVRSGFCDVTIPAKCKKIILYPENIYGLSHPFYRIPLSHINFRPIYEWASFDAMGIDANAIEIRCNYHYTKHLEQMVVKGLGEQHEGLYNS